MDAVVGSLEHAIQEESDPTLPIAVGAHGPQPGVVLLLSALERHAEVEQWLTEQAPVLHQEGDQQSSDPAVAVEKRMDRFELHVGESRPHQWRKVAVGVPPLLQR